MVVSLKLASSECPLWWVHRLRVVTSGFSVAARGEGVATCVIKGGKGLVQQKHFCSLFSVPPSGRLPPVRVGVVELQPCALRVLLLRPQEAVPGRHPALPWLVR